MKYDVIRIGSQREYKIDEIEAESFDEAEAEAINRHFDPEDKDSAIRIEKSA